MRRPGTQEKRQFEKNCCWKNTHYIFEILHFWLFLPSYTPGTIKASIHSQKHFCFCRALLLSYILEHCTMCRLHSIFSTQLAGTCLQSSQVWHHSTYIHPSKLGCEENREKPFLWASNYKFVIFSQLSPYRILAFYATIPVKIHGNSIIPLKQIQSYFRHWGSYCTICALCIAAFIHLQCSF